MENLSEYLEKAERGDPGATIAQLMADLKAGRVKHEDVHAHYKAKNLPRLNEAVRHFGEGNLFAAQRQDFPTWLSGVGWKQDQQRALDFRALEDLCAIKVQSVRDFISFMLVSPGTRKHDCDKMGDADYQKRWGAKTIKEGWRWL